VHSVIRRFAATLVLLAPIALSGATSGEARVRPTAQREPRTLTTETLPTEREVEDRAESSVILVVLDGVRWQEIFEGVDRSRLARRGGGKSESESARDLMPNLHRLIDEEGLALGAPDHGAEIAASGPQFISMPGYIEIFSGRPDRACAWNGCVPASARTIADDVRDAGSADDVALVTSWPNIARASSAADSGSAQSFVMTAGRALTGKGEVLRADSETASLLDEGSRAKAWPGDGDYRPDAFTERVALRRLAVSHPRFFFVGLGDADEYAHHGDYRGYLEALRGADRFLGELWATLQGEGAGARSRHTTLLVTADHGRARNFVDHGPRYPESGRVWLVAAGGDVRARGLVSASRHHTLSDIAPTVRTLLGIATDPRDLREEPRAAASPIPEIVTIPGTM
jgi:hypothetical protein